MVVLTVREDSLTSTRRSRVSFSVFEEHSKKSWEVLDWVEQKVKKVKY